MSFLEAGNRKPETAVPRIAVLAGELSGDILGATIVAALKARLPNARIYGVAGPRMVAAGCEAVESIDALSVMGIVEVLRELPRLLRLRASLVQRFAQDRPDVFVGIDAPDFNLGVERRLRARGIPTVHVVSPTVWAWRAGRVKTIAQSVDRMLCLYPFEPAVYSTRLSADYIGHPLADELDDTVTAAQARPALGLPADASVVTVMPGSRAGEIAYLAEPFARTAAWLAQRMPGLRFVTPVAKPGLRTRIEAAIRAHAPGTDWTLLDGRSREAMRAADVVLLASGTATLECLLLGRPMVVGYRGSPLTAFLMLTLGLLKTRHVALPNLLCAEAVVPELLQDAVEPERLGAEIYCLLRNEQLRRHQLEQFSAVRAELRRGAADRAAESIADVLQKARERPR